MRMALGLAVKGRTSPNPRVGAVVVRDGEVVGRGYHPRAGEPHAEIFALNEAGDAATGADLYVTLEPCSHHGRTPPCCEAVIRAGIARVYVGMVDPDEKVAGRGIERLRDAGIEVVCPVLEDEARSINEAYIKHRTTGMPLVVLKSAMSLDGRIASRTGDSKWITGEKSRAYAHRIRAEVDAIVIGAGTARADNPSLTARVGRKTFYPKRVVVTRNGDLPHDLAMFSLPGETIVAVADSAPPDRLMKLEQAGARILKMNDCGGWFSVREMLRQLGRMEMLSVMIEGGAGLAGRALDERVVDKAVFFYAPKIIGGATAVSGIGGEGVELVSNCPRLADTRIRRFGEDFAVEGRVVYPNR
jgi:diaminohydroxyphosphoribosylaminopyrimidine deaminase / 5-amino-6-(5-phosphoribosylamino)uracil reductase